VMGEERQSEREEGGETIHTQCSMGHWKAARGGCSTRSVYVLQSINKSPRDKRRWTYKGAFHMMLDVVAWRARGLTSALALDRLRVNDSCGIVLSAAAVLSSAPETGDIGSLGTFLAEAALRRLPPEESIGWSPSIVVGLVTRAAADLRERGIVTVGIIEVDDDIAPSSS